MLRDLVPSTETTIKTLYVFVEIAIDSAHLAQTIRSNFPTNRRRFHEALLDNENENSKIAPGMPIGLGQHLRIEAAEPFTAPDSGSCAEDNSLSSSETTRFALVSTIQFVAALARLKEDLTTEFVDPKGLLEDSSSAPAGELDVGRPRLWREKYEAIIPRSKPLSPGEILGCTSPYLTEAVDAIMYVYYTSTYS